MNHKLRVLVRVDLDPGRVTLEVGGCLTLANFPVLLHMMLRAQRVATGPSIVLDLRGASHLERSVLSSLHRVALPEPQDSGQAEGVGRLPVAGGKLAGLVEAGSAT